MSHQGSNGGSSSEPSAPTRRGRKRVSRENDIDLNLEPGEGGCRESESSVVERRASHQGEGFGEFLALGLVVGENRVLSEVQGDGNVELEEEGEGCDEREELGEMVLANWGTSLDRNEVITGADDAKVQALMDVDLDMRLGKTCPFGEGEGDGERACRPKQKQKLLPGVDSRGLDFNASGESSTKSVENGCYVFVEMEYHLFLEKVFKAEVDGRELADGCYRSLFMEFRQILRNKYADVDKWKKNPDDRTIAEDIEFGKFLVQDDVYVEGYCPRDSLLSQISYQKSRFTQESSTRKRRAEAINRAAVDARWRRHNTRKCHESVLEQASDLVIFDPEVTQQSHESPNQHNQQAATSADKELEDGQDPFSTAMKLVTERNARLCDKEDSLPGVDTQTSLIQCVPFNHHNTSAPMAVVPTLIDLCVGVLSKHTEAIVSLDAVPDAVRHKLCDLVCDSLRMNVHLMGLLVKGSPSEIRLKNCSNIPEEQLIQTLKCCDTKNLALLQLNHCGPSVGDSVLQKTLAWSSNSLPVLATVSLKGASNLSDRGVKALAMSAPLLQSINLSLCSFVTHAAIITLANFLAPTLRELYIDGCCKIDAMLIVPALKKFKQLEVLSVGGIQTVCDDFISDIITVHGLHMRELVLARCMKLTDNSLEVIGRFCSKLCVLDLSDLTRLTDVAIQYLANGCRSIEILELSGNSFSDKTIAAFLEASGSSLKMLSLNNVREVSLDSAISLAKCSRLLSTLDLSWCRNLTDEAVGLIVDNCKSLKLLKIYGCTQITDEFQTRHSNPFLRIVGKKSSRFKASLCVRA